MGNSQYKPTVSPLEIFIVMLTDTFPGGTVGRIYAADRDPSDVLLFTQKPQPKSMFRINRQDGSIVALAGLEPGRYTQASAQIREFQFKNVTLSLVICQIPDERDRERWSFCCDS